MALCPLCHRNFDQAYDPDFVFVPTDLAYFIDFENEDYEKRSRLAREGIAMKRTCPTSEMYKEDQVTSEARSCSKRWAWRSLPPNHAEAICSPFWSEPDAWPEKLARLSFSGAPAWVHRAIVYSDYSFAHRYTRRAPPIAGAVFPRATASIYYV